MLSESSIGTAPGVASGLSGGMFMLGFSLLGLRSSCVNGEHETCLYISEDY